MPILSRYAQRPEAVQVLGINVRDVDKDRVADDEPYQADVSPDVQPWRRNVDFLDCAETPIRPLLDDLDFIEDKARWGYKFRFGVFKISDDDLDVIRSAMVRPVEGSSLGA